VDDQSVFSTILLLCRSCSTQSSSVFHYLSLIAVVPHGMKLFCHLMYFMRPKKCIVLYCIVLY